MIELLPDNKKLLNDIDEELSRLNISKEQARFKELSIKRATLYELVEELEALK